MHDEDFNSSIQSSFVHHPAAAPQRKTHAICAWQSSIVPGKMRKFDIDDNIIADDHRHDCSILENGYRHGSSYPSSAQSPGSKDLRCRLHARQLPVCHCISPELCARGAPLTCVKTDWRLLMRGKETYARQGVGMTPAKLQSLAGPMSPNRNGL